MTTFTVDNAMRSAMGQQLEIEVETFDGGILSLHQTTDTLGDSIRS